MTCRFASRAKAVTNRVTVNQVLSDAQLAQQYKVELDQLRKTLKADNGTAYLHQTAELQQLQVSRTFVKLSDLCRLHCHTNID